MQPYRAVRIEKWDLPSYPVALSLMRLGMRLGVCSAVVLGGNKCGKFFPQYVATAFGEIFPFGGCRKKSRSTVMANREGWRFHPRLVFREQGVDKSKTGALKETEIEMDWIHVARSQSFKVVFLGDSSVGKTCLARLFIECEVVEHSTNTIGFDEYVKELELEDGIPVKLQVWDTAGMEQFRNALVTKYYRNADGIVLVYDITRHDSFDNIENWIKEVKMYCGLETVKMALIGNKLDRAKDRKVTVEEGQRLADRYGMIFSELSAMDIATLPKLNELFTDLAHSMFSLREQQLALTSGNVIRLGRDGSLSDDWVVVNTPSGPVPRYVYSHQDASIARLMRNRCKC